MITRVWLPLDEQHLRQVREAAGVDHQELARRCLLSIHQIQELEGTGYGKQFYSEAIKFTAGARVLAALGAQVLSAPEPAPETTLSTVAPDIAAPDLKTHNVAKPSVQLIASPVVLKTASRRLPIFKLLAGVLILASSVVWALYSTGEKAPSSHIAPSAQQTVSPTPVAAIEPVAPAEPPRPSPPPAPIPAATQPVGTTATETDCTSKLKSSAPVVHPRVSAPSKPGTYVYFVAKSATTICVQDGDGKTLPYNLKPGQSRSHYGTPPFKVWHPNATMVQMYYQGWKVTGPSAQEGVTVFQP